MHETENASLRSIPRFSDVITLLQFSDDSDPFLQFRSLSQTSLFARERILHKMSDWRRQVCVWQLRICVHDRTMAKSVGVLTTCLWRKASLIHGSRNCGVLFRIAELVRERETKTNFGPAGRTADVSPVRHGSLLLPSDVQ